MKSRNKKPAAYIFLLTFLLILALFAASLLKTNAYNSKLHEQTLSGAELFGAQAAESGVSITASARSSTWGKIFDFNNEGLSENNYQAYTYDFSVSNNTRDAVAQFSFKLTFAEEVFLASAWNGSLEIHQNGTGGEVVAYVPDLREYNPADYPFETFSVDGETFIRMQTGDCFVYTPSTSANALEIPIKAHEGTVPGLILYVANGQSIEDSSLEFSYTFHRALLDEPLCRIALIALFIWLVAMVIFVITSLQIRKYTLLHERDNVIINESIETFTGFIDAKDPYTNGHSKRVAIYTRRIAQELGYTGEELSRIYYVALLHDCGKIGVPDHILGKPGRLTDEEFEIIKSHTVIGGEVLSSFKSLPNVGEGALYHHERYDGKGYPEGKAGEDIPLIARIICVADSYDAMNTNRVYREKLSQETIIEELEKNKGRQFDPKIADIMLELLRSGRLTAEV